MYAKPTAPSIEDRYPLIRPARRDERLRITRRRSDIQADIHFQERSFPNAVSVLMPVKLARIFDTSVEELSGLKMRIRPKRRLSPAGVRHAECYQRLSKTEQRFVQRIIDTLLERVAAQRSVACA